MDLKPPELFSERPEQMQYVHEQFARAEIARVRSYRIRRVITCAVLAIALCGLIYGIIEWNRKPAEIPTIEADGALKQKPEQPGGLDVPNQDVLAYQQLDNSGNKPAPDHMLPPPETPQASPPAGNAPASLPTAPSVTLPPVPKAENMGTPSVDALAPAPVTQPDNAPAAPAKTAQAKMPPVTLPPQAPAKEETNDNAAPAPAAAPATQATPKPAGGKKNYRVQLASFPDEEEAEPDLGARGIFYRVQSNPISDDDARDICAALKKLKAGCIIVKP
jgi:hypothetical protein